MKWIYQKVDPNGGAGGEAFRIVFNGSGFDAAERVAREAIQNSVDAAAELEDGSKANPRVAFELKVFEGAARNGFRQAARLDDIARREPHLELRRPNAFSHPDEPLRVLYVVDRGTTGLEGDPTASNSKLRRLLMQIGGSRKLRNDESSGGSYGFGKAVYAGSSRIATIFAYSRTMDGEGRSLSVLMGCTYHTGHSFEGTETSGRAFLGTQASTPEGWRYDPFIDDDADDLAERLGMARKAGDIGTTIAIVDCPLEIADLRRGVEKWWWPRMLRDGFRVDLRDTNGAKSVPRPKTMKEVRPFYHAMEVALGTAPEQSERAKRRDSFNAVHGKKIGKMGLVVLDEQVEEDEHGEMPVTANSVAMIRQPGMVVYHFAKNSMARNDPPGVVGVFLADEQIDKILTQSEPPEHDEWDEKADRLADADEQDIVVAVKRRVWNELRSFKKDARPPAPPTTGRVSELERMLGKILGPAKKTLPSGPGASETPISIRPKVTVVPRDEGLGAEGTVSIALKPDAEAQAVRVSISVRAIGEGGSIEAPIHVDVAGHDAIGWDGEKAATGVVHLDPGEKVHLTIRSATYDRNWSVKFVPKVEPATAQGGAS